MLQVIIPAIEIYDEKTNTFYNIKETKLTLEHSLISISKWESIWNKPFLSREDKTREETISYIKCMTLTQNVDDNVYKCISHSVYNEINEYIAAPMTAKKFIKREGEAPSRAIITSEDIYCWMIMLNIPSEYQKWHINRLLALIKVCDLKQQPKKKMSKSELMSRNRQLNASRRAALNSKG